MRYEEVIIDIRKEMMKEKLEFFCKSIHFFMEMNLSKENLKFLRLEIKVQIILNFNLQAHDIKTVLN